MLDAQELRASAQDGAYPRPQLVRRPGATWRRLGLRLRRRRSRRLRVRHGPRRIPLATIVVPSRPSRPLSGIDDTGFHPVVWYRRRVTGAELARRRPRRRAAALLLHFGAVDYRADVWVDGRHVGSHEGGHTPFTSRSPGLLGDGIRHSSCARRTIPHDVSASRAASRTGSAEPHVIWYHRTTGIWQPVWLESVPPTAVTRVHWHPDVPAPTWPSAAPRSPAGPARSGSTSRSSTRRGARRADRHARA